MSKWVAGNLKLYMCVLPFALYRSNLISPVGLLLVDTYVCRCCCLMQMLILMFLILVNVFLSDLTCDLPVPLRTGNSSMITDALDREHWANHQMASPSVSTWHMNMYISRLHYSRMCSRSLVTIVALARKWSQVHCI